MNKVSTVRKAEIALRIARRHTGEALGRNVWWRGTVAGAKSLFGSLGRIFHVLFLEVAGLLFLALVTVFGGGFLREYHKYQAGTGTMVRVVVVGFFGILFVWFGLTSFLRARRR